VLKTSSITDQVTAHLREELRKGRWTGLMPGRDRLASELGVNGRTVERALAQLEKAGFLQSQGVGKRRRIVTSEAKTTPIRVEVILYEEADAQNDCILDLRHDLQSAGHLLTFAPQTLMKMKQDPARVEKMVGERAGRAWIVQSGSRPVLEWFVEQSIPAFALFGLMTGLPIAGAGPDKLPALREVIAHLYDLGHRKIVMLVREERRLSGYGIFEKVFLEELKNRGLSAGRYNLPEWEESAVGLRRCLESLLQLTPPTAILVTDPILYLAVKNYLADHRGAFLRKVALVCTDYDPRFDWCDPPVVHFKWDNRPLVRQVVRWVNNLARGADDRKQRLVPSRLVSKDGLQVPPTA